MYQISYRPFRNNVIKGAINTFLTIADAITPNPTQMLNEELLREEDPGEVEAENAQWDTLLASDKSQRLLDKLAAEAQAEYQAGKTRPLTFDDKP